MRTEHPRTPWKTVEYHARKSLRGKDGPLIYWAHNPKVAGSNPAPATNAILNSQTKLSSNEGLSGMNMPFSRSLFLFKRHVLRSLESISRPVCVIQTDRFLSGTTRLGSRCTKCFTLSSFPSPRLQGMASGVLQANRFYRRPK